VLYFVLVVSSVQLIVEHVLHIINVPQMRDVHQTVALSATLPLPSPAIHNPHQLGFSGTPMSMLFMAPASPVQHQAMVASMTVILQIHIRVLHQF
jgi:hypothetical protein